jgi:hypothetical protein
MGILEVKHEYLLIGDGMGADFEQVELREGSGCKKSDSCYVGRALSIQMELSSQGGIYHRHHYVSHPTRPMSCAKQTVSSPHYLRKLMDCERDFVLKSEHVAQLATPQSRCR